MTRWICAVCRKGMAVLLTVAVLMMIPNVEAQAAVTAGGAIAKGVDASKHNGAINWNQVAADGMKFAFIKVGSAKSGMDPQFVANITGAQAAGLKTGVYLYSYATTPEQAAQEASQVLQWIDGYTINFPVVYDIEDKCHKGLSNQQLIDLVNAFCTTIDAAGYYPMVYSYKNFFDGKLGICGWDRWVAQYSSSCEHNNNVCFWQYSSSGKVGGFSGRADVNYQYKDYSNLIIPEGFIEHNGNVRFYRNWKMQKGWVDYNNTRYYLDGAGNLVRGWFTEGDRTYYLTPQDGSIARGQCNVDGADYYFTAEGVKTVGWVVLDGQKFFYEPANNGIMKRDWLSDEKGNFYFFDRTDGHMYTGVQIIDGAEFLFNAEGIRQCGFVTGEAGKSYYSPQTGAKVVGFFDADNKTYYANADGYVVTGAVELNQNLYYFDETGALIRNQAVVLDGVGYHTTQDGILVPDAAVESVEAVETAA